MSSTRLDHEPDSEEADAQSAHEKPLSAPSPGLDGAGEDGEEGETQSLSVGEVVLIDERPATAT